MSLVTIIADRLVEEILRLGGPGSGHYGHAGRPGKRGGSVSKGTAMSIKTGKTAEKRQKKARVENKTPRVKAESKSAELGVAIDSNDIIARYAMEQTLKSVPPSHLEGLNKISNSPPPVGEGRSDVDWSGLYNPRTKEIYVKPGFASMNETTIIHEIGHHVTMTLGKTGPKSQLLRVDNLEKIQKMTKTARGISNLAKMGLREYSSTDLLEFGADSYLVWARGSPEQKVELAKFLGINNLDEIFGEEK